MWTRPGHLSLCITLKPPNGPRTYKVFWLDQHCLMARFQTLHGVYVLEDLLAGMMRKKYADPTTTHRQPDIQHSPPQNVSWFSSSASVIQNKWQLKKNYVLEISKTSSIKARGSFRLFVSILGLTESGLEYTCPMKSMSLMLLYEWHIVVRLVLEWQEISWFALINGISGCQHSS